MLLYLRHGDDRGEDVYRRDRPLNERGRREAGNEARRLIEALGHPDLVYVSPFRRTMETVACMAERFDRAVETYRDPRIAQHMSTKQRKDPSISPETLAVVTVDENKDAFRRRIAVHVRDARHQALKQRNVWAITHQGVIEEVATQFGAKIVADLGFLDYVILIR